LKAQRAFRVKYDARQGIFPVEESPSSGEEMFPIRINPTLASAQDAVEREERTDRWRADASAEAQEELRDSRPDADVATSMVASDATMTHGIATAISTAVPKGAMGDETLASDTGTLPRLRSVGSVLLGQPSVCPMSHGIFRVEARYACNTSQSFISSSMRDCQKYPNGMLRSRYGRTT
jgi:hypothetical protein